MKNNSELLNQAAEGEKEGQAWFMKAIELMTAETAKEFNKHLKLAKEIYYAEYEMLGCIGNLTESGANLEELQAKAKNSQFVKDIALQKDAPCIAYRIKTTGGELGFAKLSSAYPQLNDGCIEYQLKRTGKCHEKAFDVAKRIKGIAYLVTGYVSVLGSKHRYLHSRVEDYSSESVFDYTLNAMIGIGNYKWLMHAEPPEILISNQDIISGKVTYNDFARAVLKIYEKNKEKR